jgi:hypothetical protein
MKKLVVSIWLIFLLGAIGALFWYNELVFQLPTPVPKNYKPVYQGQLISLNGVLKNENKPIFFHFFNPDCPCSRFNVANFKSLVNQYGRQVHFVVVVLNNHYYTAKQIQDKFDLTIPVIFDPSIAKSCGVYSTPQVALLNPQHQLYYRGNYNRSRYCTDEKTNYAKIAINGLLAAQPKLAFNQLALRAYGCQLPNCNK